MSYKSLEIINYKINGNIEYNTLYLLHLREQNKKFIFYLYDKGLRMCSLHIIGKIDDNKYISFNKSKSFILGYEYATKNYDAIEYQKFGMYEKCSIYNINNKICDEIVCECPICYNETQCLITLCGHSICNNCNNNWTLICQQNNNSIKSCPICRKQI